MTFDSPSQPMGERLGRQVLAMFMLVLFAISTQSYYFSDSDERLYSDGSQISNTLGQEEKIAIGSYPDGAYTSGALEAVVGYEGATESGIGWYVSGGPTVTHTEAADEFGDVEFIGYVGGSYDKFYGELSAVTAEDDIDWGAKAGVKFTF